MRRIRGFWDGAAGLFDALRVYDAALREVNRARRALGLLPMLALPVGLRRDSTACPLANAFRRMLMDYARHHQREAWLSVLAADVDNDAVMFVGVGEDVAEAVARAWRTRPLGWQGSQGPRVETPEALDTFVTAFDGGAFKRLRA